MEFGIRSVSPDKHKTACIIVGLFESKRLTPAAKHIDTASGGYITNLIRRGDTEGRFGQHLLLHNVPGIPAERVFLAGCGREGELTDRQFRKLIAESTSRIADTGAAEALSFLTELEPQGRDLGWRVRQTAEIAEDVLYRFDRLKTRKDTPRRALRRILVNVPNRSDIPAAERALAIGQAIASGVALTKDLANLPANHCTPSYLASRARELAKTHRSLKVQVLGNAAMTELGMGALLAVARGSRQEAQLITIEYRGAKGKDARPHVLIGKGVTFDTGGISLKPPEAMDEMKFDMSGAASVLGTMLAVATLRLPINVVGVIPATENMPGGNAVKPGDIVTSMSGQTIEILNTDAEGRLILCDAMTYAERYKPASVIDIATLTGACVVALGRHAHGLLGNHPPLVEQILEAGRTSCDQAWQLPLWDEYQQQLDSNFADMANVGGREAGTITAACFLSRYAKAYHWAHLDIAGTAWRTGKEKGSTGRPVPLLMQYLLDRCA